jgi:hypothetical protein
MADRFGVLDHPAANLYGSWLRLHGTSSVTSWARLGIAEEFQLGSESFLNGTFDNGSAHFDGHGFDGIEIDIESRALISIGTTGNNFPPTVRHVAKVGQILGLTLGERHGVFVLELRERRNLGKST